MNTAALCVFQIETTTYGALGAISWERRYASPAVALGNIFQGLYLPINLSFQRRRSYISKDTLSSKWQLSSYYLKEAWVVWWWPACVVVCIHFSKGISILQCVLKGLFLSMKVWKQGKMYLALLDRPRGVHHLSIQLVFAEKKEPFIGVVVSKNPSGLGF